MQYPIGKFQRPTTYSPESIAESVATISLLPQELKSALSGITPEQIETPYRIDGWTVRQVVHHLADSHMNAYMRFKLALTEENPTIKGYDQDRWAVLTDNALDLDLSVSMLDGMHARWTAIMRGMSAEDWNRTFFHPEQQRSIPLKESAALYAWHGRHHVGHVKAVVGNF